MGFLLKEYRTMDLTDRTLEDIFTALADSGGIGLIIATLIVEIALGALLVSLYYRKIKILQLRNELRSAKSEAERLQAYEKRCNELEKSIEDLTGRLYTGLALEPDGSDPALEKIFNRE